MSAQLALGAMLLLSAGGLLRRGSSNDEARPPRQPISDQERRRGRAARSISRLLDRGPLPQDRIATQSGLDRAEMDSILSDGLRRRSLYRNARGQIGRTSGFHDLLMQVLNDRSIGDDAAVRAVGLILYALPGTPLRQGYQTMITARSPEGLLEDVREFIGPDKDMSDLREMFRDHVRRRRLLDLLLLETQTQELLFDIEDAGRRWGGMSTIPWFASAFARQIDGQPWPVVEELIGELTRARLNYIYDWALSTPRPTLTGLSLSQAYAASQRWHNQAAEAAAAAQVHRKRMAGNWFECPDGVHPIMSQTVHEDPSGLYWVELKSWAELQNEANLSKGGGCLKHCIGESDSYFKQSQAGTARHFSLRAPGNRPLLTMTISGLPSSPYINQARGIRNRHVGGVDESGGTTHAMETAAAGGLYFPTPEKYAEAEARSIKALLDTLGLSSLIEDSELRAARLTLTKPAKQQRSR
jgi:hypothetical protein